MSSQKWGEIGRVRWGYERFGSFLKPVHVTHGNLGPILYKEMDKCKHPWTVSGTTMIKVIKLASCTHKNDAKTVKPSTHISANAAITFVLAFWWAQKLSA